MFFYIIQKMALIKTDSLITDIRGQLGGVYFSRDKTGLHIRTMPRNWRKLSYTEPKIPPNSPKGSRAAYITSWTNVARFYRDYMIGLVAVSWIAGWRPELFPKGKAKGKKVTVYNWWMYFNMPRDVRGLPIYTRPPSPRKGLPPYVMLGPYWAEETVNLYPLDYKVNGETAYKVQTMGYDWRTLFMFRYQNKWIIQRTPFSPPSGHYWYHIGTSPEGPYTETIPNYGDMVVSH